MIKEQFFPTVLYGKDIKLNTDRIATDIINWSKQDPGVKKTNVGGWHSPTGMHQRPEYGDLVNEILLMASELFKEEWMTRTPVVGNMWANINYKDGYNRAHAHPNSMFSGVYYVKTSNDCGKLTFHDPRPGVQVLMPERRNDQIPPKHLWREFSVDPVENRIIMFPSWLWHLVEPNKTNNMRISVSFNIIQHGYQM